MIQHEGSVVPVLINSLFEFKRGSPEIGDKEVYSDLENNHSRCFADFGLKIHYQFLTHLEDLLMRSFKIGH